MNETEKKAELLLSELGKAIRDQRVKEFNRLQELVREEELQKKKKLRRRKIASIAAIFCVAIITICTLTVDSDAFGGKLFGFLFTEDSTHSDLIKEETEHIEGQFAIKIPGYVPDGYSEIEQSSMDLMNIVTYKHEDLEDYITITQMQDEGMSVSVDNETSTRERCFVGICEAYYIGGNENHVLMWDENGIFYEITSTLDKETMIEIGESLK